jgi:hypothetical protein
MRAGPNTLDHQLVTGGVVGADGAQLDRHLVLDRARHDLVDAAAILSLADGAGDVL